MTEIYRKEKYTMSIVSGNCSLIIRGHDTLDFDDIFKQLPIKPSTIVRKGEIKYKTAGKFKSDVWIYEIKKKKNEELSETLDTLISDLKKYISSIKNLSKYYEMCIRCYIQSDLAQIGFEFSPEAIKGLSELSLKLEFSILSWGEVETEKEAEEDNN